MLKLISLEIRKNKLSSILRGALYANLGLLAFMVLVLITDQTEVELTFASYAELFDMMSVFISAVFIIFAAVLLSKLVIDEYKNNTITLLFMYPISRKKLMAAKIIIVFLFTLLAVAISNIILGTILASLCYFTEFIPGPLTAAVVSTALIKAGAGAVYAAGIGLIPLYVGMRRKSVPATIISAVLIVSVISSGFDQFRLGSLVSVSIGLCLLGIGIAYLSIRKVASQDIT